MTDITFSTIIQILQHLTYAVVFLLSAGAAFLALRQTQVQKWLADAGPLVQIVLFIALSALLYQAVSPIIGNVFAFAFGLLEYNRTAGFTASSRCLSGVLVLAGLVVGSWQLSKGRAKTDVDE